MQQENPIRLKLLKLVEILRQETDEDHPLTKPELCERLEAMNIPGSRRSLIRDIALLNEQGYEIMEQMKDREKAY